MIIQPTKGLLPIEFGMTEAEVVSTAGPRDRANNRGDVRYLYLPNDINVALRDGQVFQIGASRYAEGVRYKDLDVFLANPVEVLRAIEADANGAWEDMGFIIFPSLGISLTGFHDGTEEDKAITVAVLSEWDVDVSDMNVVSFGR